MSTVKSRLKEAMDALGLKPLTPASTCEGISKNMMQKLWASKTDTVTSNILEPFCKQYPQVSCSYLLRGDGPMLIETDGIEKDTENEYFLICKLLLENRLKENELYSELAKLMSKEMSE